MSAALCVCVCSFLFLVSAGSEVVGMHQGQMCNSVHSASVPHSLSLIPLKLPPSQALRFSLVP